MDLQALASSLRAKAQAGQSITLDESVLAASDVSGIRTAFGLGSGASLTIHGISSVPDPAADGTLTLAGTADVLKQAGVPVAVAFSAATDTLQAIVSATMPPTWRFPDSFANLNIFPFDSLHVANAQFLYATVEHAQFPWPGDATVTIGLAAGLNFLSEASFDALDAVTALLQLQTQSFKFYGPFGPVDGQPLPVGTIAAPIGSHSFSVGVAPNALSLGDPAVAVRIDGASGDDGIQRVDLLVKALFQEELEVIVALPAGAGALEISSTPLPNRGSIADLIQALPGGASFETYIPGELSAIFANVGLGNFSMIVAPTPAVTYLSLAVATLEPWPAIPGIAELESLALRVQTLNPAGHSWTQVAISAQADFLKQIFAEPFAFTIDLERASAWQIASVSGSYGGAVSLADIVGGLDGSFTVPSALKDIAFSDFAVTLTRNAPGDGYAYSFSGSILAAFEMLEQQLASQLYLSVRETATGHEISIDGAVSIASADFRLSLDIGAGDSMLTAAWADTDAPLGFADVAAALGWDMPPVPQGLDLSLTAASFTYDFTRSAMAFSGTSTHGALSFVSFPSGDDSASPGKRIYLLVLDVRLGISLADLPVVGADIPSSLNVGIDELQMVLSSGDIGASDLAQLSRLLDLNHAPALIGSGIGAGATFNATLSIGADSHRLSLPLSAGGEGSPPAETASATPSSTASATPASPPDTYAPHVKWFAVGKSLGQFSLQRIGVGYSSGTLLFYFDASVAIGPLSFSLEALSVGSSLTTFDPVFDLAGLGLAYDQPPVEVAGALLHLPKDQLADGTKFQFDGALIVKAGDYSVAAIGSYAQQASGDSSLFIFADAEIALGGPPAFFVTGLMAGFGYNRLLRTPGQDEVLDFPLLKLAGGGGQDAMAVLDLLEGRAPAPGAKPWITPSPGDDWAAVGVTFTSFELVASKALLVVDFGRDFQAALLGVSTLRLPQGSDSGTSYVYAELELEAVLKPQEGFFGLTAILSDNSYVLTRDCHLTGGFAFSIWYGASEHAGQFVMTLGGYHPAFRPPSYFPQVPRLGFAWAVSDDVTIKGDAYFALTTSVAMGGGGLEVLFHDGDLSAWFTAQADFLISWHPFFFVGDIDVSIGVSYRMNLLFCHKTISLSVGASVHIYGPPTGGTVHVHLWVVSFSVDFGAGESGRSQDALGWSEFKNLLPAPADAIQIVAELGLFKVLDSAKSGTPRPWVVRSNRLRFNTRSTMPASALAFGAGDPVESGEKISIRPMNLAGVVESVHRLTISRQVVPPGDPPQLPVWQPVDANGWTLTAQTGTLPESLWGAPPAPFAQTPGTPAANVIEGEVGFLVEGPSPRVATSRGLVALEALAEEQVAAGIAPISAAVAATGAHQPAPDPDSIADIAAIATASGRGALCALLKDTTCAGAPLFTGVDGPLVRLAGNAAHLFSDAPMAAA